MAKLKSFKLGRRRQANKKRAEREADEARELERELAEKRKAAEARKQQIQVAQHSVLATRGLLGLGLHSHVSAGRSLTTGVHPAPRVEDSASDDAAASFNKLMTWFPAAGKKRRAAPVAAPSEDVDTTLDAAVVHMHADDDEDAGQPAPATGGLLEIDEVEEDEDEDADSDEEDETAGDAAATGPPEANVAFTRWWQACKDVTAEQCASRVAAAKAMQPVPEFDIDPAAIGAEYDTLTAVTMTASIDPASGQAFAGAYLRALKSNGRTAPPAMPTGIDVTASIAAAWGKTYGAEVHRIAVQWFRSAVKQSEREGVSASERSRAADALDAAIASSHPFTPLQYALWQPLHAYRDVYLGVRSHGNARELRTLCVLHALDHAVKAREIVIRNNVQLREAAVDARVARLAKAVDSVAASKRSGAARVGEDDSTSDALRDQGFTRPRVLVLLPTRHVALQYVRTMLRLLPERQVMNRNRFFQEFTEGDASQEEGEGDEDAAAAPPPPPGLEGISRKQQQMMSDDEGGDASGDEDQQDAAATYVFNRHRQGWSAALRHKVREAKRAAAEDAEDEEEDAAADADDDHDNEVGLGSDGEEVAPFSALAAAAGRSKADDRIVKDTRHQIVVRGRKKRLRARDANERPRDWHATFAGNVDDDFKVGIGISRKTVKLYADFYDADIIVASPLGLRRVIGAEGEKGRDVDFLSSIEVLVIDAADVLHQQNWAHVRDVVAALNGTPRDPSRTDFSRVRDMNLSGLSKYLRQTVCLSAYVESDLNHLMRSQCFNVHGSVLLRGVYAGTLARVRTQVRQVFQRVNCDSLAAADDARFEFFRDKVLPELSAGLSEDAGELFARTLVFVPSYLDYVRLRNLMDKSEMEFVTCCEYTEDKDVARARAHFFNGYSPVMLLTERFHFFRRYSIRGARHIIFYAPPTVPGFYDEIVNLLAEEAARGSALSVCVLYTRADANSLARVAGTAKAAEMLSPTAKAAYYFIP